MPRSLWVFRITKDDSICTQYILGQLFNHGNLRQGWGVPGLDLALPEPVWIQNCLRYYQGYPNANEQSARDRRNILINMFHMRVNDVIFLPNIRAKQQQIDENRFTIATVSGPYQFQDMANQQIQDFGHIIPVIKLQNYQYGNHTLNRSIFGAPFMHCVDQIQPHWKSYRTFSAFLNTINY